jgi:hypothetical protein
MIGRMKDRITRLEAHLDLHREQRKPLLPAWLRAELEGQGWLFDSYRVIFVPRHDTDLILGGTGHDSASRQSKTATRGDASPIDRETCQDASGPNKPTQ